MFWFQFIWISFWNAVKKVKLCKKSEKKVKKKKHRTTLSYKEVAWFKKYISVKISVGGKAICILKLEESLSEG